MGCRCRRKVARSQVGLRFGSNAIEHSAATAGKIDPLGEEEKRQEETNCQQRGNIGIFLVRLDTPRDRKGCDFKVHAKNRKIEEGVLSSPQHQCERRGVDAKQIYRLLKSNDIIHFTTKILFTEGVHETYTSVQYSVVIHKGMELLSGYRFHLSFSLI
jgi:hypothetical protein